VHAVPLREVVYYDPSEVAEAARKLGIDAHTYKNLKDAVKSASEAAGSNGIVLIAGSLYLAGEATELIGRTD
jgi:folylpolyglutamate synthase/dihydropteroate synthase